jgi:SAM-dependent methyltransferase
MLKIAPLNTFLKDALNVVDRILPGLNRQKSPTNIVSKESPLPKETETREGLVQQLAVWNQEANGFRRRLYSSYGEYLEHQKSKLGQVDLSRYHVEFRTQLRERIASLRITERGDTVLCLGARLGTECLAFIDLGCFAIGVDLNPGNENRYVLHGDFHNLQFPDHSIKHVFTNALDHVFDLATVLKEVRRVLVPSGSFIAEIVRGSHDVDGREPGLFESYWWDYATDVVAVIERHGFKIEQRRRFSYPWQGDQMIFRCRTEAK